MGVEGGEEVRLRKPWRFWNGERENAGPKFICLGFENVGIDYIVNFMSG